MVLIVGRVDASRNAEAGDAVPSARRRSFQAGSTPTAATAVRRRGARRPARRSDAWRRSIRGHALRKQGDRAGAASAYTEYLSDVPARDYLRQQALIGLGRAKEATTDASGALDAYVQAADLEGPFRVEALLAAGRLHEAAGRLQQARELYVRVLKDGNPDPELRTMLLAKLPAGFEAGQTATP